MIEANTNKKTGLEVAANHFYINEIIFTGLVVLCFIGDIIGEVSDHASIIYWLMLVPIFFLSSVVFEKAQSLKLQKPKKNHLRFILILWVSAFFSVLLIMLLWHSGAFLAESVGIIIHIILAHTLFVSGLSLGLRFYLIGLLLFIVAGLTIAMEAAVGITLIFSIPVILIGLYFKKKMYPSLKRNYSLTFSDNISE